MRTPVYVKLDAADQLLLGEGVCHKLRVITYHPSVSSKRSPVKSLKLKSNNLRQAGATMADGTRTTEDRGR